MLVTILRQRQPYHPLLGRNINFDSRSWDYALQPQEVSIQAVRHRPYIDVLNQGDVGSCTGNAAVSCAYHAPFYSPDAQPWAYAPDEDGALRWYARNTAEDGFSGEFTYPPSGGDDTGSDGLTASKVAQEAGIISGYQMAGDLDSSLQALMDRPGITGIPWYRSMFSAPSSGLLTVTVSSGLAGGHELCVDEIVAADQPGNGTGKLLVGGPNSWGTEWGAQGRWYLTADDWWSLRQQDGDVYFWTAKSQPPPLPTPTPDPGYDEADLTLWSKTAPFRSDRHIAPHIRQAVHEMETWGARKGLR